MNIHVAVRRLGADDLPAYRAMNALFSEAFEEPEHYAARPPSDAYAMEQLARRDTIMLIAEAGDRTVGALVAYVLPKFEQARSEVYIYDLAVAGPSRRQGIATALIDALRSIAREIGAWVIYVQADTLPEDEPARSLYDKLGTREDVLHFDIVP